MNPLFDDYKAIRRRIERKFSHPDFVIGHVILFFFASALLMPGNIVNEDNQRPFFFMLWGLVLLAHGLFTLGQSALWGRRREVVIKAELQQRLDNEDTELFYNARTVFYVRELFEEDIRQRAGLFVPLSLILLGNAAIYVIAFLQQVQTNAIGAWPDASRVILATLMPAIAMHWARRNQRNRDIATQLKTLTEESVHNAKPKRLTREAYLFNEEGEMIDATERLRLEPPQKNGVRGE